MNILEQLGKLTETLEEGHLQQSFDVLRPRDNFERVLEAAQHIGLVAVPCVGVLELRAGTAVDHNWIGVAVGFGKKLLPVDVALPVNNQPFMEAYRYYVCDGSAASDEQEKALLDLALSAPFTDRTLGTPPEHIRYFGKPTWMARQRYFLHLVDSEVPAV